MYDRLPETLFRTKRGLCPGCGAPLPLGEDTSNICCGFCGARTVLERRLRRAEPEVDGAPLRQFDRHDHAGWERTDRLREQFAQRATCPGCGLGIDEPEHGERVVCSGCGTESHIERRLVPPARNPLRGVARPRHPREPYVYDLRADEEPGTEHLIWRLAGEEDLDRATALAAWFEHWAHINATTARLMPSILGVIHRAAQRGARPLVFELCASIDKCLCSDAELARETVAALEEWVVRVPAERQLISCLGLGTALGLKLLLDSSMLACRAGDLEQSVACLFAINWMLQRNYPEHPIISQILMHRMFYLSGPPLAFCVMFMHGQVSDVAFRYDAKTTLAFLDDAVAERPCLVASLDHERAFWCGQAGTEEDWNDRWSFVRTLRTEGARAAAWRWYLGAPEQASEEFYAMYTGLVLEQMDDERPAWRELGEKRMEWMVRRIRPTPRAVMRLVVERGEALPGNVRQAFLSEHPTCGLAHKNLPYWKPEPAAQEHPEVVEARRLYRQGLDMHLEGKQDDRAIWKAYWEARGGRPASPSAVFDGVSDGPAPDESTRRVKKRYPRPWENAEALVVDGGGEPLRERPAPGDETAPPEDDEELVELLDLARREADGVEGAEGASDGSGEPPSTVPGDSVTIWEYVASLPEDQRGQYDQILKQMEPHRAMIEAAMAQQRGQGGTPGVSDPGGLGAGAGQDPRPGAQTGPGGMLGKLFGRRGKAR